MKFSNVGCFTHKPSFFIMSGVNIMCKCLYFVVLVSLLSITSCGNAGSDRIDYIKGKIEGMVIDSESIQYRNINLYRGGAVCGEINAKNRLGGYAGFRYFVVATGKIDLNPDNHKVRIHCSNEHFEVIDMMKQGVEIACQGESEMCVEYKKKYEEFLKICNSLHEIDCSEV
jgi:hypothetical protein